MKNILIISVTIIFISSFIFSCKKDDDTEIPIATFESSSTLINIGDTIHFFDNSLNNPSSWIWNFGDGNTNTQQNPLNIYTEPGTYSVCLVVRNDKGTDSIIKKDYISVVDISTLKSGTSNHLNSVFFANSDIGYVVGNTGTILKTINGGINWIPLTSGTTLGLSSVWFITQDIGYVVGQDGLIIKTLNGGDTWNIQNSGVSLSLNSVCFTDVDTGYAVGIQRTILKTTDGGITWLQLGENNYYNLFSVYFINSFTGITVGGRWDSQSGSIPVIHKTIDGGANWGGMKGDSPDFVVFSVFMIDINTIFISCGTNIYSSIDGGVTWLQQTQSEVTFNSIYFINDTTGCAVGYKGTIINTIDGGSNWRTLPKIADEELKSLSYADINIIYAVGSNGTIIKIKN